MRTINVNPNLLTKKMIRASTIDTFELLHRNRSLPPQLRCVWYSINQAFRKRIAHLEITPNQYTLLRWLSETHHKGLSQRELADLMASDPNTITSLLNRMEAKGLIQRDVHENDRRAYRIIIKPAGRKLFEKAHPVALKLQKEVLGHMSKPERERFLEQLAGIAQACRQALDNSD